MPEVNIPNEAIKFQAVVKRFGRLNAVNGLNLTLPHGGVTSLLGPNGAGKTTALNMLIGVHKPDEGHVWLCGLNPLFPKHRRVLGAMRQNIGAPDT
jgi:ABC-2 type transport system ATP-binding protein